MLTMRGKLRLLSSDEELYAFIFQLDNVLASEIYQLEEVPRFVSGASPRSFCLEHLEVPGEFLAVRQICWLRASRQCTLQLSVVLLREDAILNEGDELPCSRREPCKPGKINGITFVMAAEVFPSITCPHLRVPPLKVERVKSAVQATCTFLNSPVTNEQFSIASSMSLVHPWQNTISPSMSPTKNRI